MRVLSIAIGNPLRGDDGVAHQVLDLLEPAPDLTKRSVLQLTPELAYEIAQAEIVVFIDADVTAGQPRIERIALGQPPGTPLAHSMTPAEVVYLARGLYGFTGAAWVCHIPATMFEGEMPSPDAESNTRASAALIRAACFAFGTRVIC